MRSRQHLIARHRIGMATVADLTQETRLGAPEESVAATMHALHDMGKLVSHHCFTSPESLTRDRITAYALTLIRLRECASAAGLDRLVKACDALAVTVARLIEDRTCACREKCAALKRFVAHAEAMIRMSHRPGKPSRPALPDFATASGRTDVEPDACVLM